MTLKRMYFVSEEAEVVPTESVLPFLEDNGRINYISVISKTYYTWKVRIDKKITTDVVILMINI
jgi:hypothetical protein